MPRSERMSLRLTVETVRQAEEIARLLGGPVRPLSLADVMATCVARIYTVETCKMREKRR